VEEAWRRLRGLPGFVQRADELWLDALGRQSRAATTLAAAAAADARLRALPGQDVAADRLLSEFWLRRAREQAHGEQRDAAILLAQRAAALPAAQPVAAAYLAELVGDDYSRLQRSLRFAGAPEYWHMTFAQATLVAVDTEQRALRMPFGAAAGTGTLGAAPLELTALEHAALTRELAVEGEGTAGEFELTLTLEHGAPAELVVTLTAPSGAAAAVAVPSSAGMAVETFSFQAAQSSPLAQLADDGVRGVWRLTVVDRTAGNTGAFGGWTLRFGDNVRRDDLPELVAIPDPRRVAAVNVQAVADRVVAWPTSPGVVGSVALWNLATAQLEHDFTLPAAPRQVALDAAGARVLAATERVLHLWNVGSGALVARVATETEFVLPPVFSTDGAYLAIAERVDGANPLYSVLRSADGSLVATFEGTPNAQGWELGPGGRYVALQESATVIRVLEARRGAELMRASHGQSVERLVHLGDAAALVTIDLAGTIASWSLVAAPAAVGRPLGRTAAAASVSASADGRLLAFTRDDGAVAVLDVATGSESYRLQLGRSSPVTSTQLSMDGTELVTQSGSSFKLWSLPSKPAPPGNALADGAPTAIALDRTSDLLAVGLASGQLQFASMGGSRGSSLAFFGHRGPVTAAALNGGRGLAATGGRDGIVRVWDIASGSPTGIVMQPADAAIALVVLSADGRYVASAAERVVRVATVADGRVLAEVRTETAVTALAFAPDAAAVVVGDAAGTVLVARFGAPSDGASVEVGAAVASLAFAPDGSRLAVADAGGSITLVVAASGEIESTSRRSMQPIRWLEFSPDGSALLVATDAWLHSLSAATPALAPALSKLVVWPASATVMTAISATAIGFAGAAADGALASGMLDLTASEVAGDAAALVARDWPAAFALRLNDNGEPVPFDP
jgi:WD40 repeat protein/subtilisin-like proprotein convertase family protein